MKITYSFFIFFLLFSFCGFAQATILCGLNESLYIKDPINIPTVSDNGNGTVTLTHEQQFITDIFAKHIIYDFIKGTSTLYTIKCLGVDLINELSINVPSEIFSISGPYEEFPISSELINFFDGKTFNLVKQCFESSESGQNCPSDEITVPQDFSLQIEFNYDSLNNLLLANNKNLTPCGNSFSIAFKGGKSHNTLKLRESIPKISSKTDYDLPCHNIERTLYSIFDISCHKENYGDLIVNLDDEANKFTLERENGIFATNFMSFEEDVLSTTDHFFENIKLVTSKTNAFIEFINIKKQDFYIEVFSILGEEIIKKHCIKNTLSL